MAKYYTLDGNRRSVSAWAKFRGISRQAMTQRLSKVESPEELRLALTCEDYQGESAKAKANRKMAKRIGAELKLRAINPHNQQEK